MNKEYNSMKEEMKTAHGLEPVEQLKVSFMPLDLSSFQSTVEFVEMYKRSGRKLHVLILNAGVAMLPFGKVFVHLKMLSSDFTIAN